MFDNVGIVGVGLIGSSMALEIRNRGLSKTIIGFDSNEKNLNDAIKSGVIDEYASLNDIGICDFVITAAPVLSIPKILKEVFSKLKKDSIVIDVGSVKGAIIDEVKDFLTDNVYYVPVHPIAGIEKFGVQAAKIGLFKDAYCIITPFDDVNTFALNKVENFIRLLEMRVEIMDPYEHDEVFAYISHLPHIIAYGLVSMIEEKNNEKFKFIGGGFRDFTRIAASSERMWSDIFLLNKKNMLKSIDEFINHIEKIKLLLEEDNAEELMDYLKQARLFKESLDER